MAAPKRLRVAVGNDKISAYIAEIVMPDGYQKATCPTCSPVPTKMSYVASVDCKVEGEWRRFDVWRCSRCRSEWALGRSIEAKVE